MDKICECCGNKTLIADRVSISGMFDNHCFHKFNARSVDGLIFLWLAFNSTPNYMRHSEHDKPYDAGPVDLCPAIVISDDKEMRRVGEMVHIDYKTKLPDFNKLEEYRQELLNDPDISSLLAANQH